MIGDVAGHGPDEAALGVALRIAWRALTFAGLRGTDRMRQLERILRAERAGQRHLRDGAQPGDPARQACTITAVRAGHPGMLLHGDGHRGVGGAAGRARAGPASRRMAAQTGRAAARAQALVLLTDGLFEGHFGRGNERLGEERACSSWPVRWRRCPARSSSTR